MILLAGSHLGEIIAPIKSSNESFFGKQSQKMTHVWTSFPQRYPKKTVNVAGETAVSC